MEVELRTLAKNSESEIIDAHNAAALIFIRKIFPYIDKILNASKLYEFIFIGNFNLDVKLRNLKAESLKLKKPLLRQIHEQIYHNFIFFMHHELKLGLASLVKISNDDEKFILASLRSSYIKIYPKSKNVIFQFFYFGKWIKSSDDYPFESLQQILKNETPNYLYLWKHQQFEQIIVINPSLLDSFKQTSIDNVDQKIEITSKKASPLFYGWWGKVIRETAVLVFLFLCFIFAYNHFSIFYQNYLLKKISMLEINHASPDTKLVFKSQEPPAKRKIDLKEDDFKKIQESFVIDENQEFLSPETDILATNIDLGQKSSDKYSIFSYSNSEDDFRDTQYGFYKSYRLLVKSSDVFASKSKILELVKKFQITPVTNELVGNEIPGGVFFNLHVPSKSIENFVRELNQIDSVNVYISKSSRPSPAGKEKVFLWIKEI